MHHLEITDLIYTLRLFTSLIIPGTPRAYCKICTPRNRPVHELFCRRRPTQYPYKNQSKQTLLHTYVYVCISTHTLSHTNSLSLSHTHICPLSLSLTHTICIHNSISYNDPLVEESILCNVCVCVCVGRGNHT